MLNGMKNIFFSGIRILNPSLPLGIFFSLHSYLNSE